jgi:hypothetical protein
MKLIAMLALLFSASFAWDWDTHQWFAEQLCNAYNCSCMNEAKAGAIAPDQVFKDTFYHHLYDPAACIDSPYYTCPTEYDNAATQRMGAWLANVSGPWDCEDWYRIGVASHYFTDSKCIWHNVKNEDYEKCHKPFEDKVGELFKGNRTDFSVTQCGETVYGSNFSEWGSEFMGIIEPGGTATFNENNAQAGIGLTATAMAFIAAVASIVAIAAFRFLGKRK